MKILYIAHEESCYCGSFIFNGLCELLGPDNVLTYPPKLSYYGQTHRYSIPGIENGLTSPLPWMSFNDPASVELDDATVRSMIRCGDFKFVVVESVRSTAVSTFESLRDDITAACLPVALVESDDYDGFDERNIKRIMPHLYFKRELRKKKYDSPAISRSFGSVHHTKVIGFPFSCPITAINRIHTQSEAYDVFFSCGNTTDHTDNMRQRVADAIRNNAERLGLNVFVAVSPDRSRSEGAPGLLPWDKYIAAMKASKILINCRGFGHDTVRFWEAAGCGLLCTQPNGLHYANEYTGMENIVEFDSPESCIGRIEGLLQDEDKANEIRAACVAHTAQHHTNLARAHQLVSALRENGFLS